VRRRSTRRFRPRSVAVFALLAGVALVAGTAAEAWAQNSSLIGTPQQRGPLTLSKSSWTYEPPLEIKQEIKLHDLVTVVVSQQSVVISEGEMDRKKKAHGDLVLSDWILLKGLFHVVPDPQSNGDPHISGKLDNKMRSEANLETRDSIKFRIACHVVDIRPNGNLVLEGRHTVCNNCEVWDCSLTGEIRPEDVLPNNTVLSENVADLRIQKRESGHVRDGYRRGWLLRILDEWQPF
jgi:flagellar L-ring protein precursor FlgH